MIAFLSSSWCNKTLLSPRMTPTFSSSSASTCHSRSVKRSSMNRQQKTSRNSSIVSCLVFSGSTRRDASYALTLSPRFVSFFTSANSPHTSAACCNCSGSSARVVHVQPAVRRSTGTYRRDVDAESVRTWPSARDGTAHAVDI